jgi:hypothetical protein
MSVLTGLPGFKNVAVSRLECYPMSHRTAPFLQDLPTRGGIISDDRPRHYDVKKKLHAIP